MNYEPLTSLGNSSNAALTARCLSAHRAQWRVREGVPKILTYLLAYFDHNYLQPGRYIRSYVVTVARRLLSKVLLKIIHRYFEMLRSLKSLPISLVYIRLNSHIALHRFTSLYRLFSPHFTHTFNDLCHNHFHHPSLVQSCICLDRSHHIHRTDFTHSVTSFYRATLC